MRFESREILLVLHLPPLPGAPGWTAAGAPALSELTDAVISKAQLFASEGATGLIMENFGDAPFYPGAVPPETVASMAVIGAALRRELDLPLGINVLRNDGAAALALAVALGAEAVRVNVLSGVAATDQGLVASAAHDLLRERERLSAGPSGARAVKILADVHVKHARPLGEQDIATAAIDLAERAGADAVIVSGTRTGSPPSVADLDCVGAALDELDRRVPLLLGSGVNADNAAKLVPRCNGAIVASAALKGGRAGAAADPDRTRRLIAAIRDAS